MRSSVACKRTRKSAAGERGQAILELLPVVVLLLTLTFAVIDFSRAIWQIETMTGLTRGFQSGVAECKSDGFARFSQCRDKRRSCPELVQQWRSHHYVRSKPGCRWKSKVQDNGPVFNRNPFLQQQNRKL